MPRVGAVSKASHRIEFFMPQVGQSQSKASCRIEFFTPRVGAFGQSQLALQPVPSRHSELITPVTLTELADLRQ